MAASSPLGGGGGGRGMMSGGRSMGCGRCVGDVENTTPFRWCFGLCGNTAVPRNPTQPFLQHRKREITRRKGERATLATQSNPGCRWVNPRMIAGLRGHRERSSECEGLYCKCLQRGTAHKCTSASFRWTAGTAALLICLAAIPASRNSY